MDFYSAAQPELMNLSHRYFAGPRRLQQSGSASDQLAVYRCIGKAATDRSSKQLFHPLLSCAAEALQIADRNIQELGISTGIPLTEYRADVVSTRICVRGLWERQLAVVDPDWWR
jgi:hypothetical protein